MTLRLVKVREYLRSSLWFLPTIAVLLTVAVSTGLLWIDRNIGNGRTAWYLYGGSTDSARVLLSTIASSVMTFIGLVFSITILVLQLASGQFSPRVLRTFLRDRTSQLTLSVFIATFAYSLLTLRVLRVDMNSQDAFVPALSVTVAFAMVLLSLGVFVYFINHIAHSIRAVTVIEAVASETRRAIEDMYPDEVGEESGGPQPPLPDRDADAIVRAKHQGVVVRIDGERLMGLLTHQNLVAEIIPMVGDFMPEGAPLMRVWSLTGADVNPDRLHSTIELDRERTMEQDPMFGLRQLVDIAEKALSPGINDPTTAVQSLDQIHDLLRRLAGRRFPDVARADDDGLLRVVAPRPTWDDYVRLGLDEIRQYSSGSIQVIRRMRHLLEDLSATVPPSRSAAVRLQLELLDATVDRHVADPADRDVARRASPQGHGAA